MVAPSYQRELLEQVSQLGDQEQRRVLEFARLLGRNGHDAVPGTQLLSWAGIIPKDDVDLMKRSIEDACESIDPGEWNAPS